MIIVFIAIAILVLSFLIFIHELGHFLVAKKSGVWVEEFGIGLPPRVWGKKIGETIYSLNALPFGGFVRLHGEAGESKITKLDRAFVNKSKKVKVAVALAGIFMNFIFAFLLFYSVLWIDGIGVLGIKLTDIVKNTPAEEVGLMVDDGVVGVNGVPVSDPQEFIDLIIEKRGEEVVLDITRPIGREIQYTSVTVVPRIEHPEEEGALGVKIGFGVVDKEYVPLSSKPFLYTKLALNRTVDLTYQSGVGLVGLVKQLAGGGGFKGVGGPVEIIAIGAETAKYGLTPTLEFAAFISISLGFINIVPFPPLDGSRVLFVAIEAITGRKLKPKHEEYLFMFGMILLLGFLVLVTFNNLPKLFSSNSIAEFIDAVMR